MTQIERNTTKKGKDEMAFTNEQLALNMIFHSRRIAAAHGWTENYTAPKNSALVFDALIGRFYESADESNIIPSKIDDAARELLSIRDRFEKSIFKMYPKINKKKFKSTECDSEIAKITNAEVAYQLGTLDLLIGGFLRRGAL